MEKESESELENKINIESENKKRVKENIHWKQKNFKWKETLTLRSQTSWSPRWSLTKWSRIRTKTGRNENQKKYISVLWIIKFY
jgi:hypothetical protein